MGRIQAGRRDGGNDQTGGVEVTAEECLLCSLFAMVSSDRHVRNAQGRTAGLGMLPSKTSLAVGIVNICNLEYLRTTSQLSTYSALQKYSSHFNFLSFKKVKFDVMY